MTRELPTAAQAIAHAREILAPEDEHLSARLDDVERGTTVAQLEDVFAWITRSMAAADRLRPLEYRKLAAVQAAARARRAELTQQEAAPSADESRSAAPPASPGASGDVPPAPPRPWWRRFFRD
ncbi:MAG TPA: hypothetical protein VGJ70_22690 [Solirubrobacteraceae bacterium]